MTNHPGYGAKVPTTYTPMTMDTLLWDRFGAAAYGTHPWDDFAAYTHLGTRTTVVTTHGDFGGDATWYMDDAAGTAHYVGDTCGAYVFGDFVVPDFGPTDTDWACTYTWTTDLCRV